MIRGALQRAFLPLCGAAVLLAAGAAGQTIGADQRLPPQPLDVRQVLSWLPTDTETVIVTKEFSIPDFEGLHEAKRAGKEVVYTTEVAFGWFSLGPWVMMSTPLASYFKNEKAFVAVEGSRKFRSPKGIGLMPFEGCTFIAFAGNLRDRAEQSLTTAALRVEEVEGQKILVFQGERPDTWTTFVGFSRSNVLLVATNIEYLREALSRMRGKNGLRALPETLPEWRYVDTSTQFWGLRHFDRSQSQRDADPSSPFWDPRKFVKAPWTDEQAIGLTFSYDPATAKGPTITYLSGDPGAARETLSLKHERDRLGATLRDLDARAIMASYSLEHAEPLGFTFYLSYLLGHGDFL